MSDLEARLAEVKRERDRYQMLAANAEADRRVGAAKTQNDRFQGALTLIGALAALALFGWIVSVAAEGAAQQAELETAKAVACTEAGGIWDRTVGSCAWSRS